MRSDDEGFTLVELLLSAAILTIIMAAITGALITFLKNGAYTIERDDHSGGAVVLSSYLNRDLASAEAHTTSSAPCSGSGTSVLNLSWREWTATPAAPAPVPVSGNPWRTSYVVTSDAPAVGGAARFQLLRRSCPPTGAASDSLLLRSLAGPATSVVAVPPVTPTSECPAGRLLVSLPSYADDTGLQGYSYSGCLKGRTR